MFIMSYFSKKKLPPLPPIFQLMWGVLPTLPPSETASDFTIMEIGEQDLYKDFSCGIIICKDR